MNIKLLTNSLKSILKEQREEILTFEKDPIEYIVQKYPSLEATLIDLLTNTYKDYLTGIYVMAPKPTTFKILLHNGHSFYLIYNKNSYICKVSGKKYDLIDIKDEEYATKAISKLLLLGIPPNSQGPDEQVEGDKDSKNSFVGDMTSEPDLGGLDSELDDLENTPDGGSEEGGEEPEEELQEEVDNTPKPVKFRIVREKKTLSEIKVNSPSPFPITINSKEDWQKIVDKYKDKYKLDHDVSLNDHTPLNIRISEFPLIVYERKPGVLDASPRSVYNWVQKGKIKEIKVNSPNQPHYIQYQTNINTYSGGTIEKGLMAAINVAKEKLRTKYKGATALITKWDEDISPFDQPIVKKIKL